MATNRKEHLRFRYGICLNDGCSKCKSKEVQQISARKDFVCEECQKPLRECPPPKTFWQKYGKAVIGVCAALLAAGIIVGLSSKGAKEPVEEAPDPVVEQVEESDTDSTAIVQKPDSLEVQKGPEDTKVEKTEEGVKPKPETGNPAPIVPKPASSIKVPYGTYSGPADGLGGQITVTKHYSLDLRNAAHETIELQPGDIISRTQFRNGELVAGYWQRGTQSRNFHR